MIFSQVPLEQFNLGRCGQRHVIHVDPSNSQFRGVPTRKAILIEPSIAWHIVGHINCSVRPNAIHISVVRIGRPRTCVVTMPVGCHAPRIWHRDVSEQQDLFHLGLATMQQSVVVVVVLDDLFDRRNGLVPVHIVSQHRPAITHKVRLQTRYVAAQCTSDRIVYQKYNLPTIFDGR